MVNESFSIYIHIPFCSKKCPYCHFFVVSSKNKKESQFIEALFSEWDQKKSSIPKDSVVTLYLGGGTPTELSKESLQLILRSFRNEYPNLQEITVEANPESVTFDLIKGLKEAGCNRISLGVQSLVDDELISLNRQHHKNKAKEAIHIIHEAGIKNISIDLMYDIPGQSVESFEQTLKEIPKLPITHLSLYNLVIEDHTAFKRIEKKIQKLMPKEEESLLMLHKAIDCLENSGLKRYEISAFAKPGYTSMHNIGYWTSRPFIGLGPSAFSDDGKKRSQNVCNLQSYYQAVEKKTDPVNFFECLSDWERFKERFIVRLRLFQPIKIKDFIANHGKMDSNFLNQLKQLAQKNYLKLDDETIELTPLGADFFEEIAVCLI